MCSLSDTKTEWNRHVYLIDISHTLLFRNGRGNEWVRDKANGRSRVREVKTSNMEHSEIEKRAGEQWLSTSRVGFIPFLPEVRWLLVSIHLISLHFGVSMAPSHFFPSSFSFFLSFLLFFFQSSQPMCDHRCCQHLRSLAPWHGRLNDFGIDAQSTGLFARLLADPVAPLAHLLYSAILCSLCTDCCCAHPLARFLTHLLSSS